MWCIFRKCSFWVSRCGSGVFLSAFRCAAGVLCQWQQLVFCQFSLFYSEIGEYEIHCTDCGQKYSHDDCGHFVYQKHLPVIKRIFCSIWIVQINWNMHKSAEKYLIFFERSIKWRKQGVTLIFCDVPAGLLNLVHSCRNWFILVVFLH